MIVVCSACQARFKVADDKIGPRGSRVRHSLCRSPGRLPAAHTTTSRGPAAAFTSPMTSPWLGPGLCPRS